MVTRETADIQKKKKKKQKRKKIISFDRKLMPESLLETLWKLPPRDSKLSILGISGNPSLISEISA